MDGELEAGVEVLGEEGAGVDHCPGGAEVSNGHTDHCRTGQYPRPGNVSQPGDQWIEIFNNIFLGFRGFCESSSAHKSTL